MVSSKSAPSNYELSLSLELLIDFYHFDKAPLVFQALWKPAVFYFIDMFNTITGDIAKIDQGQPHLAEKKSLATQHNEARYRAIHVLTELEVHPVSTVF